MDFGKEKFGGPFTEEEVGDVKTVLRLLPLVMCLSLCVSGSMTPVNLLTMNINIPIDRVLTYGLNSTWLLALLLIPCSLSILNSSIYSQPQTKYAKMHRNRLVPPAIGNCTIGSSMC